MFKLIKGFHDPTLPSLFVKNPRQSKGHSEKLNIKGATKDIRKYSFTVRAIKIWNSLPQSAIDAETIVQFESELDEHWQNQEILYDNYNAEINLISNNKYDDFSCTLK